MLINLLRDRPVVYFQVLLSNIIFFFKIKNVYILYIKEGSSGYQKKEKKEVLVIS